MTYPLVLIRWEDAVTEGHGWRSIEQITKLGPETIQSVGWVVKETDKSVTLVSSITEDGDADGDVVVPKSCIVERKTLVSSS